MYVKQDYNAQKCPRLSSKCPNAYDSLLKISQRVMNTLYSAAARTGLNVGKPQSIPPDTFASTLSRLPATQIGQATNSVFWSPRHCEDVLKVHCVNYVVQDALYGGYAIRGLPAGFDCRMERLDGSPSEMGRGVGVSSVQL